MKLLRSYIDFNSLKTLVFIFPISDKLTKKSINNFIFILIMYTFINVNNKKILRVNRIRV